MLLYYDGFDYGPTGNWNSGDTTAYPWETGTGALSVVSGAARTGIHGVNVTGGRWRGKNITATQTLYAGAAINITALSTANASLMFFMDNGNEQVTLKFNTLGQLYFTRGSGTTAIAGPSFYMMPTNQFHYVEIFVVISSTVGQVRCWVDGSEVIALTTGLNTQVTGNASANQFGFGLNDVGGGTTANFDDIYILDTTGPAPQNTRLGDVSITTSVASASGSFTQWTIKPSSSKPTNWQNTNEIPADGDTTYVFTAVAGNRDSYVFNPLTTSGTGTIYGVMVMGYVETDAGGTSTIEFTDRQAGTDNFSSNISLGLGYVYSWWIAQNDVNGNPWLVANLNLTEFGIKATSLGQIDIGLSDTNTANWNDVVAHS